MTEVMQRAKDDRNTVHLANLADLCHLQNAKLATLLQKTNDELYSGETMSKMKTDTSQMAAATFFGHTFTNSWCDWRST